MKTPRPKKQPKIKKPKKVKEKKQKVFIKLDEKKFDTNEIVKKILEKYSDVIDYKKRLFIDGLNGLNGMLTAEKKPEDESINNHLRCMLGYHVFGISGAKIELISLEAFKNTIDKNTTFDHVFGSLPLGKRIYKAYIESNYDINYMVNEWFPKNLYLWVVVEVTKKEHSAITKKTKKLLAESENPNDELEYNFKRKLEHYEEISQIGFLVKE